MFEVSCAWSTSKTLIDAKPFSGCARASQAHFNWGDPEENKERYQARHVISAYRRKL